MNYKKYHRDETYNKMESTFRNIFQKRYDLIKKYQPAFVRLRRGKVLDIGCSNGVFLDIFKDPPSQGFGEVNWETWGVETSTTGDRAEVKGHRILKSSIEEAKLPVNYFDLVIMNHTLEHLENPKEILEKAKKSLKKDGVVYLDVPNVESLLSRIMGSRWPYLLPNEHLWQFDKKSLTKLVKNAGFKVIHWESRSGIFEYANPFLELHRKKFLFDVLAIPYSLIATALGMGDSMSIIGRKKE